MVSHRKLVELEVFELWLFVLIVFFNTEVVQFDLVSVVLFEKRSHFFPFISVNGLYCALSWITHGNYMMSDINKIQIKSPFSKPFLLFRYEAFNAEATTTQNVIKWAVSSLLYFLNLLFFLFLFLLIFFFLLPIFLIILYWALWKIFRNWMIWMGIYKLEYFPISGLNFISWVILFINIQT